MIDARNQSTDLPELLSLYERAAIAHGKASETGDYKTANKEYQIVAAVYRELRAQGVEKQKALLRFLNHSDAHVRVWAGAHALEFAPERGEAVLTEISQSTGIPALDAELTLEEWRKGNLRFP